jgi:hypothetical protein
MTDERKTNRLRNKMSKVAKKLAIVLKHHSSIGGAPTKAMMDELKRIAKEQNNLAEEWNELHPLNKLDVIKL